MIKTNILLSKIESIIKTDSVLFFDMDGTLVDTDFANYSSYKIAVDRVLNTTVDIPFKPNERLNRNVLKSLIPDLSAKQFKKIAIMKAELYKEHLNETILNSETVDILIKYSKTNKTVLVTNCREKRAIMTLQHHNLIDNFSHKFYKPKTQKIKYNKYQHAISSLKALPSSVIILENESPEIDAAIMAGIPIENIISI